MEWTEQLLKELDVKGVAVARDLLDPKLVGELGRDFDAAFHGAVEGFSACDECILLEFGSFRRLITDSGIVAAQQAFLGLDLQLLALDAIRYTPHSGSFGWHADIEFNCGARLSVNTAIYLDDMGEENGPLYVVPGSQNWGQSPPRDPPELAERFLPVGIPIYSHRGDVIFFDTRIWHSPSPNRCDRVRRSVLAHYGRYWMKRLGEYNDRLLPSEILNSSDKLLLQLTGLKKPDVPSIHLGY